MASPIIPPAPLRADVYARALDARDARFDGLFFVGITTTRVYCRPVCPARVSVKSHRRFFDSAGAAERAGFRPCLRCRPELAPGRAPVDAVPRLADAAARRIAAGALNGRTVAALARDLGVSERHLRRALDHELGVSPVELAQTHRLLLAKQLLADTALPVTDVAFASGFQSLRRFNAAFREQYRMPPSAVRRAPRAPGRPEPPSATDDYLHLTLAYRAPLAWDVLVALLRHDAVEGVEVVTDWRYGRTVSLGGRSGVVFVDGRALSAAGGRRRGASTQLGVHVSRSLVPVLMPLLARLRHLFDLDAEPSVIDAHLTQGGIGDVVRRCPGVRIPGALDGFDVALRTVLRGASRLGAGRGRASGRDLASRVAGALGEPLDTGVPMLSRLAPSAARVADAGAAGLEALGVPHRRAAQAVAVARMVVDGTLRLEPGSDLAATRRALANGAGLGDQPVTAILMRARYWPDAFPASDRRLQRAAGVRGARELAARAEQWRPWRAYAALHLWRHDATR